MRLFYLFLGGISALAVILLAGSCGGDSGGETVETVEIDIDMVYVPGGTFVMGCSPDQDQGGDCYEKSFEATLSQGYYIGKYEVTQGLWKEVMGEHAPSDSHFSDVTDNLPVDMVSWDGAQAFIAALNRKTGKRYRLPTEAEWEFAARGGEQGRYLYPGSDDPNAVAWHQGDVRAGESMPVGGKVPNGLGIYDMAGNVAEWVNDWVAAYTETSEIDPKGPPSGENRGYRGGGWRSYEHECRIWYRKLAPPGKVYTDQGFRLAHDSPM